MVVLLRLVLIVSLAEARQQHLLLALEQGTTASQALMFLVQTKNQQPTTELLALPTVLGLVDEVVLSLQLLALSISSILALDTLTQGLTKIFERI